MITREDEKFNKAIDFYYEEGNSFIPTKEDEEFLSQMKKLSHSMDSLNKINFVSSVDINNLIEKAYKKKKIKTLIEVSIFLIISFTILTLSFYKLYTFDARLFIVTQLIISNLIPMLLIPIAFYARKKGGLKNDW